MEEINNLISYCIPHSDWADMYADLGLLNADMTRVKEPFTKKHAAEI